MHMYEATKKKKKRNTMFDNEKYINLFGKKSHLKTENIPICLKYLKEK